MIYFDIKEESNTGLYNFSLVIDTGNTVVTVAPGLVELEEAERLLYDIEDDLRAAFAKVSQLNSVSQHQYLDPMESDWF